MTAADAFRPARPISPGRYLLCSAGRLYPLDAQDPIDTVAIVTVRARPANPVEQVRQECASEAAEHASRVHVAKRLTTAHPLPVAPRPRQIDRPLARRKVPQPAPALPDPEDGIADFTAALARVQERRRSTARVVSKPASDSVDGKAIAAAFARKKRVAPPAKSKPTQRALSGEGCEFCGVPGRRGCDHFLPFEGG